MRSIIISTFLILTQNTFANNPESVFLKESVLPAGAHQMVIDAVSIHCPTIVRNFGLKEIETEADKESGGKTLFVTTLNSNYDYDFHPSSMKIKVVTTILQSTGEPEVLMIQSEDGKSCH